MSEIEDEIYEVNRYAKYALENKHIKSLSLALDLLQDLNKQLDRQEKAWIQSTRALLEAMRRDESKAGYINFNYIGKGE